MGHAPLIGDLNYTTEGLLAIDEWLAAVEADHSDAPLAEKIAAHRTVEDRCSNVPGVEQIELPTVGQVCRLQHVETRYATPRMIAGEGIATDANKCRLKPLRRTDYYPAEFSDAQWTRLRQTFPTGVCDWSRPGVSQQDTIPWMTYENAVGGKRLGPAPRSATVPLEAG
jgi:hypothetical protein